MDVGARERLRLLIDAAFPGPRSSEGARTAIDFPTGYFEAEIIVAVMGGVMLECLEGYCPPSLLSLVLVLDYVKPLRSQAADALEGSGAVPFGDLVDVAQRGIFTPLSPLQRSLVVDWLTLLPGLCPDAMRWDDLLDEVIEHWTAFASAA